MQLYLADMGHFGAVNAVYNSLLPAVDPPGRACVQLPLPAGCPVAVSVTAVCGGGRKLPDAVGGNGAGGRGSDSSTGSWETVSNASDGEHTAADGGHGNLREAAEESLREAASPAAAAAAADHGHGDGLPAPESAAEQEAAAAAATAHWVQSSAAPIDGPAAPAEAADTAGAATAAAAAQPGRRVLHVQSVSEWAPTCIGPYSQGVASGGLVLMSGVIPLDPPTMQLVAGVPRIHATESTSFRWC